MHSNQYSMADVSFHKTRDDLWLVVQDKVYDVSKYVRDHPGGVDLLLDCAGADATQAYQEVGHSEDADEVLKAFCIGSLQGATRSVPPKPMRLVQQPKAIVEAKAPSSNTVILGAGAVGLLGATVFSISAINPNLHVTFDRFLQLSMSYLSWPAHAHHNALPTGGFTQGFAIAVLLASSAAAFLIRKLDEMTYIEHGFTKYPAHIPIRSIRPANPHAMKGFLDPKEYQDLPLVRKDQLSPNVFRFVFELPNPNCIIGLPIGQHVAIMAHINGQSVSRSYTPTSNNLDRGRLDLVIKCYPNGLLTGRYMANLNIGDKVSFRGPKGPMRYYSGLCKKIGMIAGGTGITPMYQLIRAICENDTDLTEVDLVYACRTEGELLLRQELEFFARNYPRNLKLWYMLDQPSRDWEYGAGYITADVISAKLPRPSQDTKMMLCGPPGMVNASKKALVSAGFQAPGTLPKITDQIFCF